MSKELKAALVGVIVWIVAAYIGTSFYHWSFNPAEWSEEGRASLLALFFLTPVAAMFGAMFGDDRRW